MEQQPPTQAQGPDPLANTPAHAVASFISNAAPDDAGRTMATAMLTLSCWQMSNGPLTATVPSVLLVNAGDAESDPLDDFMEDFVFHLDRLEQYLRDGSNEKNRLLPGDAHKAMRLAVWGAEQLIASNGSSAHLDMRMEVYRNQFHSYRSREIGDGPAARYTRAYMEEYGWLSNRDNRLVLRLDHTDDRKAMREDLLTGSNKLYDPKGFGWELAPISKKLALSGSVNSAEWDESLVTRLLTAGWPVLFLPHTVMLPLRAEETADLHLAFMKVDSFKWQSQVTADDVAPEDPWLQHHFHLLLSRLSHMPMDYSFAVQRMVRELGGVCVRLAIIISNDIKSTDVNVIMGQDLFRKTLRAILIGVAGLAYHGWGFDAGCPRETVATLLQHIRDHGPLSRRELQRKFPALGSQQRDEVIAKLEAEGVVECEGRRVRAVPLSDFMEQLQTRPEFPKTGTLSCLILGRKVPKADPLPGMEEDPKKRSRKRKKAKKDSDATETEKQEGEFVAEAMNHTLDRSHT